jgi:hypothetical protein
MDRDPEKIKTLDNLEDKSFIELGPGFNANLFSDSPKPYLLVEAGSIDESVTENKM